MFPGFVTTYIFIAITWTKAAEQPVSHVTTYRMNFFSNANPDYYTISIIHIITYVPPFQFP